MIQQLLQSTVYAHLFTVYMHYIALCKKVTVHQVTIMLVASKMSHFQVITILLTTGTDDLTEKLNENKVECPCTCKLPIQSITCMQYYHITHLYERYQSWKSLQHFCSSCTHITESDSGSGSGSKIALHD